VIVFFHAGDYFRDLYAMLLVVPLIGLFIYIVYATGIIGSDIKRETVYQFYERYCDAKGKLKPEYLELVYSDYEEVDKEEEPTTIEASEVAKEGASPAVTSE